MKVRLTRNMLFTVMLLGSLTALAFSQAVNGAANSAEAVGKQNAGAEHFNLEKGANEFGVWTGGSFHSPTLIGVAEERKLFLLGLRYGRVLGGSRAVAIEYTADVIPVALVFQPDFARQTNQRNNAAVYGVGLSPIGFRFIFNRRGRVKPFIDSSGGFLYSLRPVPVDVTGATRFNFAFEFGGGLQFFTFARRAITVGFKFHHLSNANRSRVNPGMDSDVIYAGFSFFR